MRALGCLLAASFLLGACASVPLAGPAADSDGKRFDPPPPGPSALSLYRVDVVPGRHVINCSVPSYAPLTQTPAQAATVDLAPGEIRFLEVDVWPGLPLNPRCVATEVSAVKGRAAVTDGNRAVASN